MLPVVIDLVYILVKTGVNSAESYFEILQQMLSGPDAFFTSRRDNDFSTLLLLTTIGLIDGVFVPGNLGMSSPGC